MRTQQATYPALVRPVPHQPSIKPVLVPCGLCRFVASALSESRALRGWAAHRILKHGGPRDDKRTN